MTKRKSTFKPMFDNTVGIYVCGITAYDFAHIGNARVYVVFDMIVRYLRSLGYEVVYVRNVTDIDDKIINRANAENKHFSEIAQHFTKIFHEDMLSLNVLPPDHEPYATDYIIHMIDMIRNLIKNDYAYVGKNGDVFYDVSEFKDYGKLSHQDLDALRAGERVAVSDAKNDPIDFVLWKLAKEGEPSWDSPWGAGRPGWHIECSAMCTHCLDHNFDIHGGGQDLIFPHHENEIAQSEGAKGFKYMNNWMHIGFVQVDSEKMSKSLKNFFTIRDVTAKFNPEVVRYFLLSSHYRSPINYTDVSLQQAKAGLERLYTALRNFPIVEKPSKTKTKTESEFEQRFKIAMDDDFNTPEAFAVLFDLASQINKTAITAPKKAAKLAAILRRLGGLLGLLEQDPRDFLQGDEHNIEDIEKLVAKRDQARLAKNWAESDRLRMELESLGVMVEDSTKGTLWRKK